MSWEARKDIDMYAHENLGWICTKQIILKYHLIYDRADMMTSCWFENPDERPPFSSIAVMFEEICGTNTENMVCT